ncbi:ferritin-like domain-containing protein [bacterium]|nr:ferritin-like domain-containing protein [bacterium]
MRNLRVKEIIEYAKKLEHEAFSFYTTALKVASDKTKELIQELAFEEEKHYNLLDKLLNDKNITPNTFDTMLSVDTSLMDTLDNSENITESTDELTILNIAAKRELDTKALYAMYLTFDELPQNIFEIFENLANQEEGHYNIIQTKIKQL